MTESLAFIGTHEREAQTVAGVLRDATETLRGAGIEVLVIGGIATSTHGRPGEVRDIDLLVREADAADALEALARAGFDTKVEYPDWLYKARKSDVLVDLIFKAAGDISADDEMFERSRRLTIMQTEVRLIAPEDLIVMLAAAARDGTAYWHGAEGVVERNAAELDWQYLLRRARPHALRVVSILFYSLSEGVEVPRWVVRDLYEPFFAEGIHDE